MPKKSCQKRCLTNREAQDLDVEIGFIEGVVKRDPQYVDALQILGDNYTRRGRFTDGLKIDIDLSRLCPDDPLVHYNLACSYALTRQPEASIAALERALDLGYQDVKWIRRDPDLRGVRRHPLYRRIRERLRVLGVKSLPSASNRNAGGATP